MASSKASLVKPDEGVPTPNLSTSFETLGYSGLKQAVGRIYEEADVRLRFPAVLKEIDAMALDPMISAALHRYTMMIGSRTWKVVAPKNASKKTQERAAVIDSMRDDMQGQTWSEFICEASSFIKYGFSVHELVLYKRLKEEGSRYNDGLVGIKGIPSRAQHSVKEWVFDKNVRSLLGWKQSTAELVNGFNLSRLGKGNGSEIDIPLKTKDGLYKTLLFNADSRNSNPEGRSILLASWSAFKMKQLVEQSELTGLSRDLGGVVNISCPAKVMSADASDGDKATFEYLKNVARNFHNNQQSGIVLPSDVDETTKARYYNIELLSGQGSKGFAINDIMHRLNMSCLLPLACDDLLLGAGSANGSNALAASKDSRINQAIEYRLKEMQRVLNQHLIPTLYKANGWDLSEELPAFEFSELDPDNLEERSAAIMRIASNGLIERNRTNLNYIYRWLGLPEVDESTPIDMDTLTGATSKSGEGSTSPSGVGTSTSAQSGNDGKSNASNKA